MPARRGNCVPLEPEPAGEIGTPARPAVVIYPHIHRWLAAPQTVANPCGLAARGETGQWAWDDVEKLGRSQPAYQVVEEPQAAFRCGEPND